MMPHELAAGRRHSSPPPVLVGAPMHSAVIPAALEQQPQVWDEDHEIGAQLTQRGGFEWYPHGLAVWTATPEGVPIRVFFPLHKIDPCYQQATTAVGCPIGPNVGDYSVGGFFKKIGRAFKKVKGAIKNVKKKIAGGIKKVMMKNKFTAAIWKVGDKIHRVAKKVTGTIKKVGLKIIRSKPFRAALGAAAVAFPVIAPAVAVVETAQQIADRIEKAKKVAKAIKRGIERPGDAAILLAGKKAKDIAETALRNADKGERDGMEFAGAWSKVSGMARTEAGRKAIRRGAVLASRKAARRRAA